MRILVTGGAGFIGSHLVERLLADGHHVICFDDFNPYYDPRIKWSNVAAAQSHPNYRLVVGDLCDHRLVDQVLADANLDEIVHLAARAGVRPSIDEPELYYRVNCEATAHLFEAARRRGIERIVFASSSSVYGGNTKTPFSEADSVDGPVSPYAATKKAGELLAHTYVHLYGMSIACLRFFTVYGPRQRPEMAIHKFIDLVERGEPLPVFGDGTSARDYTYVDDIVEGICRVRERHSGYSVFNLGNSSPVLLRELVERIGEAVGKPPRINRLPDQPGDVAITFADISKAKSELDWTPVTGIEDGLRATVSWYRFKE